MSALYLGPLHSAHLWLTGPSSMVPTCDYGPSGIVPTCDYGPSSIVPTYYCDASVWHSHLSFQTWRSSMSLRHCCPNNNKWCWQHRWWRWYSKLTTYVHQMIGCSGQSQTSQVANWFLKGLRQESQNVFARVLLSDSVTMKHRQNKKPATVGETCHVYWSNHKPQSETFA